MMKEGLQATRHPLFKDMDWSYRGVQGLYVLEVVEWSDADMVVGHLEKQFAEGIIYAMALRNRGNYT
ncbi:predicted protein [Lichtheimia corymbifera JMRC:FSU:9682]|uniref:Uncharacterized protein n=1 Tax=Lichtheimia corymbifera JMRC:FSU:9682 TaxID=1263082 RepID=A0A068S6T5_9FUNG|nr:predicted protein [Lichtheimia corymbifera JMRC:FSU:9682]